MNLLQRIEKLESIQEKGIDAERQRGIEEIEREIKAMSTEQLKALIAQGENEPPDPELKARLAAMTNEELCGYIYDWRRDESRNTD